MKNKPIKNKMLKTTLVVVAGATMFASAQAQVTCNPFQVAACDIAGGVAYFNHIVQNRGDFAGAEIAQEEAREGCAEQLQCTLPKVNEGFGGAF